MIKISLKKKIIKKYLFAEKFYLPKLQITFIFFFKNL